MLTALSPRKALLLILAVAVATIVGAWIFEAFGYAPCELCLKQRWAYYTAIPLAAVLLFVPDRSFAIVKGGLWLLALIWLGSAIFGVYHSGVEWKWWAGPDTCGGVGFQAVFLISRHRSFSATRRPYESSACHSQAGTR